MINTRARSVHGAVIDVGFDFSGRHIVVTGGTRGTGLHLAQAFREAGATVSVTGTKILPSLYDADLDGFSYHQLQLTSSDAIDSFVDRIGTVDVLVNAAGARLPGALDEQEREFMVHSALLGFIGPRRLAQQLRARLCASESGFGGTVIHTSSTLAWFELSSEQEEAETELRAYTGQVGHSWSRLGTRVNTVLSPAHASIPSQPHAHEPRTRSHEGAVLTRTRRGASATASTSMAPLALFLASSGSAAITGQTFDVRRASA